MMNWQVAESILADIRAGCAGDGVLTDARELLLRRAIDYARLRTDWNLLTVDERRQRNAARTAAHNALIDACNILSRAMAQAGKNISWRERLGEDRKGIGDFACYAHAIMGIAARQSEARARCTRAARRTQVAPPRAARRKRRAGRMNGLRRARMSRFDGTIRLWYRYCIADPAPSGPVHHAPRAAQTPGRGTTP
jgi:hypothetical protein